MNDKNKMLTPSISIIIFRILGLFSLYLLWFVNHGSEVEIVFLVFLINMAIIRWRFNIPTWSVLIEQIVCIAIIPSWQYGVLALILPVFEAVIKGKYYFIFPSVIIYMFYLQRFVVIVPILTIVIFLACVIRRWQLDVENYIRDVDKHRLESYELQRVKEELITTNIKVARMAEAVERNRISQKLHDDVGHELTASILALQAFEQLWNEGHLEAKEMFFLMKDRITKSVTQLRETVHNIKPTMVLGIDRLEEICSGFTNFKIDFKVYGDTTKIPVHLWSVLEPSLKEGLTNVAKHSNGDKVDISLDVATNIVRLSINDNGIVRENQGVGIGIRNLRQRARAVGGNLSIDVKEGFTLICILPIRDI